ncbi:MAG: hypothetical protein WC505_06915 [Patescibacteria group bacterium]
MIRIRNISRTPTAPGNRIGFKIKGIGTSGMHAGYLDLEPQQQVELPRLAMKDWPFSAKQALAEYVAHGLVEVAEVDSVHLYKDKGHDLAYSPDYILAEAGANMLTASITAAIDFTAQFNQHAASTAIHTAAAVQITHAVPTTTLASLQNWLVNAGGAQLVFVAHLADAAAHSTLDNSNAIASIAPVSIPAAAAAVVELMRAYTAHKEWFLESTAAVLNVPGILTY